MLAILRQARGLDFEDYRPDLLARVAAAQLAQFPGAGPAGWIAELHKGGAALDALAGALSVSVTSFFRDPESFSTLERQVLPALVGTMSLGGTLRVWAIGCATGEEAWSLAMLLEATLAPLDWEILATDIDQPALAVARAAVYRNVATVPTRFAERFLLPAGHGSWAVVPELRRRVRFVTHAFMGHGLAPREAIVPQFPLVVCRNVLLHFDERLRGQAWRRLAEVTDPDGALLVSPVERPPEGAPLARWPGTGGGAGVYRRRSEAA